MITKEYGKYILVCDDCLKEVELDSWNEVEVDEKFIYSFAKENVKVSGGRWGGI